MDKMKIEAIAIEIMIISGAMTLLELNPKVLRPTTLAMVSELIEKIPSVAEDITKEESLALINNLVLGAVKRIETAIEEAKSDGVSNNS
ncbi:hypothetical protein [Brevibacillus laterosporus]|uniref:hypothetical protein n=1 Tax=Brevibacillus laterosporus TaxID=1465 RepID=UPI003D1C2D0E